MPIRVLIAVLVALCACAVLAPAASAVTCAHGASAYGTGGAPGAGAANDPLFPKQWGLDQVNAPEAWARGARAAGVTIAVLDTGVDLTHPDLQPKLVPGTDLVPARPGSPGDPGAPAGGACPDAQDEEGHGTHVAGIAAAVTGNGVGVAGTAPDASILPVRVLDENGEGGPDETIAGIRQAADRGAKVINLSLGQLPGVGQSEELNEDVEQAIDYAFDRGAVVVAAAGNESFPLCSYPSAARRAVCVGATDRRRQPAAYSNFPADPDSNVGVRAPGGEGSPIFCEYDEDVWSTIWPESGSDCGGSGSVSGYDTIAGTSMAAPFVAGVAALLAGNGLSPGQIIECLRTTSSNRGAYDPVMGYGIVDADHATASCSPAATPSFTPPPGGGPPSGQPAGPNIVVTVSRTTRAKLARSGRLRVRVKSDRAVTVKLRAVLRKGNRLIELARGRVKLTGPGTRKATLKLNRAARKRVRRSSGAVQVRWSGGGRKGVATAARR